MFFGVAAVQDLDRARKPLGSDAPVILCAIGNHHHPLGLSKTAARRFSPDALGKLRGALIGVDCGRALDGGRVGDRAWVADGTPFPVAGLGAPNNNQFAFARLGFAVRLLAGASDQFFRAHGDAGAINAQIQGGRKLAIGEGRGVFALVIGHLMP